jgi:putative phosphoesterase
MKIAALGDIHGNYQALITVLDHVDSWKPDLVLILGDLINRGPRSKDCYDLVLKRSSSPAWYVIKGNHEGYVLNFLDPDFSREGVDLALRKVIYWTYKSLLPQDLAQILQLPEEIKIDLPGVGLIQAAHASTAGDRVGIYPSTPDDQLPGLIPEKARLFLVGHTHQPLVRTFNKTLVINTGSVGLPFDGDTRASYARITYQNGDWQGEIARVAYDLNAAESDFHRTGFIAEGGPLADLILAELQLGWPQLGRWFRKYEMAVRQGEIQLQEAVYEFLKNPNIETINSQ